MVYMGSNKIQMPTAPEELTIEWLNAVLSSKRLLPKDVCVEKLELETIPKQGATSRVVLLKLVYNTDDSLPLRLIAKFSCEDLGLREAMKQSYQREVEFYQNFEQVGIRIPRCFYASYDVGNHHSLILLEFMENNLPKSP